MPTKKNQTGVEVGFAPKKLSFWLQTSLSEVNF
jgi:hypothetical protein